MHLALQISCQRLHQLESYETSLISPAFIKTSFTFRKCQGAHLMDLYEISVPNVLLISNLSKSTTKVDRLFKSSCRIRRSAGQNGSHRILTVCPLQETVSDSAYC